MEAFFLVCFLVGFGMTVLSLLLGVGHVGGLHLGHGGHADATHGDTIGLFNITTLMTFLTWFGGVGYLVARYTALGVAVSLLIAAVAGIGGGAVVALFITRVLVPGQTLMVEADYSMPGTVARVSSTIFPGHAGEVTYTKAGATRTASARGSGDEAIARGTEVVILKYEHGIAYVDTWQHALEEGSDAPAHPMRAEP